MGDIKSAVSSEVTLDDLFIKLSVEGNEPAAEDHL